MKHSNGFGGRMALTRGHRLRMIGQYKHWANSSPSQWGENMSNTMHISEAPNFVQRVADSLPYDIVEVTKHDNHYSLKTESGYIAEVVPFLYIVKDCIYYKTFSRMVDAINYLEDDFQFCLGDEVRECPRLPDDAVEKEEYDRKYYAWEEACWSRGEVFYK